MLTLVEPSQDQSSFIILIPPLAPCSRLAEYPTKQWPAESAASLDLRARSPIRDHFSGFEDKSDSILSNCRNFNNEATQPLLTFLSYCVSRATGQATLARKGHRRLDRRSSCLY